MKKTQKQLMMLFACIVILGVAIVILFETNLWASGCLADNAQTEFLLTTLMELMTLGCAFLGLRLFKFKKVKSDLIGLKETALKKWGTIRLGLLGAPLIIDTLLYYTYMKATFGYLALILVLCLPFVYPSMDRCLSATEEEPEVTEPETEKES